MLLRRLTFLLQVERLKKKAPSLILDYFLTRKKSRNDFLASACRLHNAAFSEIAFPLSSVVIVNTSPSAHRRRKQNEGEPGRSAACCRLGTPDSERRSAASVHPDGETSSQSIHYHRSNTEKVSKRLCNTADYLLLSAESW